MELYRVSEVLSPYIDFSMVKDDVLEAATQRGSTVDLWCNNYARMIWSPTPEEYQGYCLSFKNWFNKYVAKVLFVQEEFRDEELGIIGHPDLISILIGEVDPIIVDNKTPLTTYKTWEAQIAVYIHLAQKAGIPVKRGGDLKLRKDGGMAKFIPCNPSNGALPAFLSALNAHRYFKERR